MNYNFCVRSPPFIINPIKWASNGVWWVVGCCQHSHLLRKRLDWEICTGTLHNFNQWQISDIVPTWGNFSKIPAVWINSHPKIRKSISVSRSKPSNCDGVCSNFVSGSKQFSSDITICPYTLAIGFAADSSFFVEVIVKPLFFSLVSLPTIKTFYWVFTRMTDILMIDDGRCQRSLWWLQRRPGGKFGLDKNCCQYCEKNKNIGLLGINLQVWPKFPKYSFILSLSSNGKLWSHKLKT